MEMAKVVIVQDVVFAITPKDFATASLVISEIVVNTKPF
jgi:hypothetical protein